jgi:hypothetical protein
MAIDYAIVGRVRGFFEVPRMREPALSLRAMLIRLLPALVFAALLALGVHALSAPAAGVPRLPDLDQEPPSELVITRAKGEYRLELARGSQQESGTRQDDVADLALDIDTDAGATRADTDAAYQVEQGSHRPFELQTVTIQGTS